jgi:hypothetical protein
LKGIQDAYHPFISVLPPLTPNVFVYLIVTDSFFLTQRKPFTTIRIPEVEKMAWRPNNLLIEGQLDNTIPGKVTGWMRFIGLKKKVQFDLDGNFHRDIRGARILLKGDALENETTVSPDYMEGISLLQKGKVGDITAGLKPCDYVDSPYIEWYSESNGRVVIELDKEQIVVVGKRISPKTEYPISRREQQQNMLEFMAEF